MKIFFLSLFVLCCSLLPSYSHAAPITISLTFYDGNGETIGDGWYSYDPDIKTSAVSLCNGIIEPHRIERECGYYPDLILVQNAYIEILGYEFGRPYANYALGGLTTGAAFEIDSRYQSAGYNFYWRWGDYQGDYFNLSTDRTWSAPRIPELRSLTGTYEVTQVPLPGALIFFLAGLPFLRLFNKKINS